jgi:hypothetical protein
LSLPTYTAKCDECGQVADYVRRVADRESTPECCGRPMWRTLTAPMIQGSSCEDVSYKCPMTGEVVKSLRRRQYLMEANNVVDSRDLYDSWKKKIASDKQEKADLAAFNASIPEAVKKAAMDTAPAAPAA